MDDVGNAFQSVSEAGGILNGAQTHFWLREAPLNEPTAAGLTQQQRHPDAPHPEPIQDVTSDESARACEQDLQSDQAKLFANCADLFQSEINLLVRVRGH